MTSLKINKFYDKHYEKIYNTGLIGSYWKRIHKKLSRFSDLDPSCVVLELGAGDGQHYAFSQPNVLTYIETDLRYESDEVQRLMVSDLGIKGRIRRIADAQNLSVLPNESIDRVIASCVVAHLDYPDKALDEWWRVLKRGGNMTIYCPCEPGLFLRIVRYLFVSLKYKTMGISQSDIHWIEHRNSYPHIKLLVRLKYPFAPNSIVRYPFRYLPWDLNLYAIIKVQKGRDFVD